MRSKVYPVIVLAVCAAIFSFYYLTRPAESPESTVEKFTQDLFRVAPPSLDKGAINSAFNSLSDKAKEQIKSLADIASFAGIQSLPDSGYKIVSVYMKEQKALVKMKWDYSGGPELKNFYMVLENGKWKIDRIQSQKLEVRKDI